MLENYEWAPHRWYALRDLPTLGEVKRGQLSPSMLAQELVAEPWQVLIACCLLNRTRREQAHPALWRLLAAYPTPMALAEARICDIEPMIRSCGFGQTRATTIGIMATGLRDGASLWELHGVGKYARDSWKVFVDVDDDAGTDDHEVEKFLRWSRLKGLGIRH